VGEKALWPTVAVVAIICAFVGAMLVAGKDVVDIIAVFSLAGNVITLMLYGKMQQVESDVQKVEKNTNGTVTSLQIMLKDLIEHAKNSTLNVPVDSEKL